MNQDKKKEEPTNMKEFKYKMQQVKHAEGIQWMHRRHKHRTGIYKNNWEIMKYKQIEMLRLNNIISQS